LKLAEKGATMVGYNVMFYLWKVPFAMVHMLWSKCRGKLVMEEQIERGIEAFGEDVRGGARREAFSRLENVTTTAHPLTISGSRRRERSNNND